MITLDVSFGDVHLHNSASESGIVSGGSVHKAWTNIDTTSAITVGHWSIERNFASVQNSSETLELKEKMFLNFRYYPILSISMLVPALASMTLLWAYLVFDSVTINPGILLWCLVGFGGMYVVLMSAGREIYEAEKQAK